MRTADPTDAARVELLLTELRLPAAKLVWADVAAQADKEGWPAARFLAALAEHEMAERARRRIERHRTTPEGRCGSKVLYDKRGGASRRARRKLKPLNTGGGSQSAITRRRVVLLDDASKISRRDGIDRAPVMALQFVCELAQAIAIVPLFDVHSLPPKLRSRSRKIRRARAARPARPATRSGRPPWPEIRRYRYPSATPTQAFRRPRRVASLLAEWPIGGFVSQLDPLVLAAT